MTARRRRRRQGFARTAAGVCALYSAGIYKGDRRSRRACDYLMQFSRPAAGGFWPAPTCTTSTATTTPCRPCGRPAALLDGLVSRHPRRAGRPASGGRSWTDQICSHYATAMACIILQVPNNYLPILQK